jgi:hypothetical protein
VVLHQKHVGLSYLINPYCLIKTYGIGFADKVGSWSSVLVFIKESGEEKLLFQRQRCLMHYKLVKMGEMRPNDNGYFSLVSITSFQIVF